MDPDLALVMGVIIGIFSVPSILSAFSDSRAPRASALTILIAFGLIFYAIQTSPSGYSLEEIPKLFVRVAGRYMP